MIERNVRVSHFQTDLIFHTFHVLPGYSGVSSFGQQIWKMTDLVGSDIRREIIQLDPRVPSQTVTVSISIKFPQ